MQRQAHDLEALPVLTLEQHYRTLLASFPTLTKEQEQALVQRAQAGENVRDEVVLSLQRRVYALATKYLRPGSTVERMDLVQAATEAMLQSFPLALVKENPCSYLLRVARLTMINSLNGRTDRLIKTYHHEDTVPVLSLDQLICKDGATLADLLPVEVRLEPTQKRKDAFTILQAIETLPEMQRLVIQRHYGLTSSPESLNTISRSLAPHSPRPANAHYYNKRALATLRKHLSTCAGGVQ